jgi:hypothetical protein
MFIEDKKSRVYLLKNCPLDTTYEHTIQFDSREQQAEYFSSLAKYREVEMSYVRHTENKVYVELLADNIYDCNYIMFQNSNFGNKWFYYFVTNVEYVNNNTSMLTLACDVMQTWYFDYELGQCFVEREHSKTDKIGDNIVDENLDCGDYIIKDWERFDMRERVNVLCVAWQNNEIIRKLLPDLTKPAIYSDLYGGCVYLFFDNTESGADRLSGMINSLVEANFKDAIISLFTMPKKFASTNNLGGIHPLKHYHFSIPKNHGTLDGYKPRNNKMYIFPYNYLEVSNNNGSIAHLRYEFFEKGDCTFDVYGNISCSPEVISIPQYYKNRYLNYDEKVSVSGFPQLSYSVDMYTAWFAQSIAPSVIGTAGNSVIQRMANPLNNVTNITNVATDVVNTMSTGLQYAMKPPHNTGNNNGSILATTDLLDIHYIQKTITYDYAKSIDNFFTMYGYATKKLKKPNIKVRKNFTYTKVKTCVIKGSVPANDLKAISSIYKKGITFWLWPSKIGDYSVDNSPL